MSVGMTRIGVDPSQYGSDPTVIATLQPGRQRAQIEKLGGAWNVHQLADDLQRRYLFFAPAVEMTIEGVGVAAALVDLLRSRGIPVREAPGYTMAEALLYVPVIEGKP
jgi:hypothetical protein